MSRFVSLAPDFCNNRCHLLKRRMPKPLTTETAQFFAIARDKDDGVIGRINAALALIHRRAPN